jgi:small ligand-binding sensory domain FIST
VARCGDGLAVGTDLESAAVEAAERAVASLDGRPPDLACVFAAGHDPDDVAAALELAAERTGARASVGCSAAGVIGSGAAVEHGGGVSVLTAALPGARLRAFHLEVMRTPESMAVLGLPQQRGDDQVALLLADPWSFPSEGFVLQSNDALPGLRLVGGLASGTASGATRLLVDGRVVDRGAVGVVIGNAPGLRTVVSQGCRPVGPLMTVTAADGNVLLGLAGMPALSRLKQIVAGLPADDQALATLGLQVGVSMDEYADERGQGDFLVRGILGFDSARDGIVVADVLPVGCTVQLQVRDADAAATDLAGALASFRDRRELDPVDGALLFSCDGRGAGLFGDAAHDVRAVRSGLRTSAVAGFFAAGEIGPVAGRNHLHALSATLLVLGGAEGAS